MTLMNPGFTPKGVLTVDIVDFSLMKNQEQLEAVQSLIKILQGAVPEAENRPDRRLWSPSGDGGSLTFEDLFTALETAKNLSRWLNDYNTGRPDKPPLRIRTGLHCGTITVRQDFDDRLNVWGEGINISARVAGLAKPGQILASEDFCERTDLLRVGKPEVTYLGRWWVKHNEFVPIYNLYFEGTGIPPSEVDVWFEPFSYPLRQAIETYGAMMEEERQRARRPFRVAVLCKRLLDLQPGHAYARDVLESFSQTRHSDLSDVQNLYHWFLSPLLPNAICYFFENATFQYYRKGETIVTEGEDADSLMMVVSGEVAPYIRGNPIPALTKDKAESHPNRQELVFGEGAIIGEMGLFTEGQKRTATLVALKNSTVLELKYRHLPKPPSSKPLSPKPPSDTFYPIDYARQEIRNQIWGLHRRRTVQNQVQTHPLLQKLTPARQIMLADRGDLLPDTDGALIKLPPEDGYKFWTFVVSGSLTAWTTNNKQLTYVAGECLGPIRLVIPDKTLFTRLECAPDTQIVRFPWGFIKELLEGSAPEEFVKAAKDIAERDRARLS